MDLVSAPRGHPSPPSTTRTLGEASVDVCYAVHPEQGSCRRLQTVYRASFAANVTARRAHAHCLQASPLLREVRPTRVGGVSPFATALARGVFSGEGIEARGVLVDETLGRLASVGLDGFGGLVWLSRPDPVLLFVLLEAKDNVVEGWTKKLVGFFAAHEQQQEPM